jgi:nicotinate-nucleotide pyrophosphorylase (carboxylating)
MAAKSAALDIDATAILPPREELIATIDRWLAEDIGRGDITSRFMVPAAARAKLALNTRHDIVVCGIDVAGAIFQRHVPDCTYEVVARDGTRAKKGDVLARVSGPAHGLLEAERTALNVLQLLTGIATLTARYADLVKGTPAQLIDTRKTIPGYRQLSKYATVIGGARNHRMRLDDGILLKDNHIAICGSIAAAVKRAKALTPALTKIEVECDRLDQVKEALDAGADVILLDNMDAAMMKRAAQIVDGRCELEASGGITLETIREKAQSGVNYISVGRMTQSAPAADIGLDVDIAT